MVIFLAEINGLCSWGADKVNECLEAFAKEKVCAIAVPEFEHLRGHTLLIKKALCGLRTSGLRWHE